MTQRTGMNKTTGRSMDVMTHLRQSVTDILTTPIGTRVMRRDYGSLLFALVDQPLTAALKLDIIQATVGAIQRWEPRVRVERVEVAAVDPDLDPGHFLLDLDLSYRLNGARVRLTGIIV